jgi:hypothetical protein
MNGKNEAPSAPLPSAAWEYGIDAWQRSVLFLDAMRERALQFAEHAKQETPNVLDYDADLVLDGRTLPRPVNYLLVRIRPEEGVTIDPKKRPFVIVDPRAGHGPGIGGFKADSEIGVAMKAGHTCYFIGFLPDPVPGQTIEDITMAEAAFLEKVISLHPEADSKPCVVGNCQAGWAMMIVNALRPELFGPIIVAGSPLSYWAGVKGQYPMRYAGGLLGGSWLTALTGDLGAGTFDGAWLVQNFENQNPANTLWTKQYNLWSKIDTEVDRYLGFEKWWGGHVTLNAEEMQWIVDELFVGNRLAAGEIRTSDGTAVDLRNIRSPIVVFCSKGDNVTPPQQALDWILDLYDTDEEIRTYGQTIVYTVHDRIGHLGIFVSAGVARKEHDEFASNIDFLDVLPPGLYEAVLEPRGEAIENPDLVTGEWVMRCEPRTLDDIRALGGQRPRGRAALRGGGKALGHQPFALPRLCAAMGARLRDAGGGRDTGEDASAEAFVRDVRSRQSLPRVGRGQRRADPRGSSPRHDRQPFPRRAGAGVPADRRGARDVAQDGGDSLRAGVPRDLRLACTPGGSRDRHEGRQAAPQGGQEPPARRAGGAAHRPASRRDGRRERARGRAAGARLCRNGADRPGRTRVRSAAADPQAS